MFRLSSRKHALLRRETNPQLVIVNRKASPFGRGARLWYKAGTRRAITKFSTRRLSA
jgi:hypothetical protein